ncbi:MAG: GEVED domain-containing protein [Flavobacteriales bacterium]
MRITKKLIFSFVLGCSSLLFNAQAQEKKVHFDNKPYVEGEFLIQVTADASLKGLVSRFPEHYGVELVEEVSAPMRIWLIKFNHNAITHEHMHNLLYRQKEVTIADYNYHVQMRSTIPNDTQFGQQWHHVNTGQSGGTPDADIDSDLAWDITTGGTSATGEDIVVCIIEATNLNHTDLNANRWINTAEIAGNGIDDDGNGYVDDIMGWNPGGNNGTVGYGTNNASTAHGTNCAGMIGAIGNNNLGVAGANWNVKIMIVTVSNLTQANVISSYTYPLVQRQRWNNTNGVQGALVVATSASWGIDNANPANYPLWCAFYDTLGKYGIISVGATTNNNTNVDINGDMPTACASQYMVGVGRTGHTDNTAGGYGVNTIDFGAPGINVRTTANSNAYGTVTGTSFSCPLTAGVIGLAYSIPCPNFMALVKSNPQQGANLVLQALWDGVDPKPNMTNLYVRGGRLNAKNTLDELMNVVCAGSLCLPPSAPTVGTITNNSATITWTAFASADSYTLYYREVGAGTWTSQSTLNTSIALSGLQPCTQYEFYLESNCGGDVSNPTTIISFSTVGCGNCIDLNYCTNNATDAVDEWIQSFQIGAFTHVSGNDNGYGNHTSQGPITLDLGATYPITVTPAWSGAQYNEQSRIWIDLDQNGIFDANEMVYDQGVANQLPATGNITIPLNATIGSTRMRVQMAYIGGGQATFPGICGSFTWGEVEDYCVEIVSPTNCGFAITSSVINPICSGVNNGSITLNVSGASAPYTYAWTPNVGSSPTVSNLAPGSYSVVISDAASCDTTITFNLSYQTTVSVAITPTHVTCNGGSDGQAVASATGGTGYNYQWVGGPASATYTGLTAGNYTVNVTDANGCTASAQTTITQPAPVQASFTSNASGLTVNFTNTSSAGTYAWDFGDGNNSTQTNPSHTYAVPGNYNVCLTVTTPSCGSENFCSEVSIVDNTNIMEVVLTGNVEVYPNPADKFIVFKFEEFKAGSIELFTANGKLVHSTNLVSDITEINIEGLSTGMYFYQIKDTKGNTLKTDKFSVIR